MKTPDKHIDNTILNVLQDAHVEIEMDPEEDGEAAEEDGEAEISLDKITMDLEDCWLANTLCFICF